MKQPQNNMRVLIIFLTKGDDTFLKKKMEVP